ncbi:hypothetical protein N7471_004047 [Penicillium samsonianum]|uniref:uncharacterized protein n=1 Tax=Penicillium samsonianum TaxID=1882272 RepID=UPI0025480D46|nr:uncharacterized protein N7471_004047 [Penicillium samsonianum]KAJ6137561.1 hypothetical protein N7471_004047 [Penicillium samsonianum]
MSEEKNKYGVPDKYLPLAIIIPAVTPLLTAIVALLVLHYRRRHPKVSQTATKEQGEAFKEMYEASAPGPWAILEPPKSLTLRCLNRISELQMFCCGGIWKKLKQDSQRAQDPDVTCYLNRILSPQCAL